MKARRSKSVDELIRDTRAIEAAVRRGARGALIRHKRAGVPIAISKNGKTVLIPADQIEIPPEDEAAAPRKRRR